MEKQFSIAEITEMLQKGQTPPNIKQIDDTPEKGINVLPKGPDRTIPPKPWTKSSSNDNLNFLI